MKPGDILSEISLYRLICYNENKVTVSLTHIQSGKEVKIATDYLKSFCIHASEYDTTVQVGIQNKFWTANQINNSTWEEGLPKAGDLKQKGIQTIWSEIGEHCFTVVFQKKGKELSDKAYKALLAKLRDDAVAQIEATKLAKKGVSKTAAQVIDELLLNPPSRFEAGELRTLHGIKLSHTSDDGFYHVSDLDILEGDNKRLVNINTIKELIFKRVKYIVE